jgi:hypothetical protein
MRSRTGNHYTLHPLSFAVLLIDSQSLCQYAYVRCIYVQEQECKVVLCLTNCPLRRGTVLKSECIHPRILDLGIAAPAALPGGGTPVTILYGLDGPQNLSERCGAIKMLDPIGTQTPATPQSLCQ